MFCSPCEPLSSGIWGNISAMESLHSGFLPHGFCPFQNYLYLLPVLPKPGPCTTVFLETDTIWSDDVSEHIKYFQEWIDPQPIIISQRGSAWLFINGEGYIIRSSGVGLKKMVPFSHPMLLCTSRREWYSWIQGKISVLLFLNADTTAHHLCSLFGETGKSHSSLP